MNFNKTTDYVLLKEGSNGRRSQVENAYWFNLVIFQKDKGINPLKYNVKNLEEYNQRLAYFTNLPNANIKLRDATGNEYPLIGTHFENNYGLTPSDELVVFFKKQGGQNSNDLVIEYDDQLFGNGIIKATFTKNDLTKIPNLIN
jgi:hypothetical protein